MSVNEPRKLVYEIDCFIIGKKEFKATEDDPQEYWIEANTRSNEPQRSSNGNKQLSERYRRIRHERKSSIGNHRDGIESGEPAIVQVDELIMNNIVVFRVEA